MGRGLGRIPGHPPRNGGFVLLQYTLQSYHFTDSEPPEIVSVSGNETCIELGSAFNFEMNATDFQPDSFKVLVNGTEQLNRPWTNDDLIMMDYLAEEVEFYTIEVQLYDTSANLYIYRSNFSVIDSLIPSISGKPSISVQLDSSTTLSWNLDDNNAVNYTVLQNGNEVISGFLEQPGLVDFDFEASTVGSWNLTVLAVDQAGNQAVFTTLVNVFETANSSTQTIQYTLEDGFGILLALLTVNIAALAYRMRQ